MTTGNLIIVILFDNGVGLDMQCYHYCGPLKYKDPAPECSHHILSYYTVQFCVSLRHSTFWITKHALSKITVPRPENTHHHNIQHNSRQNECRLKHLTASHGSFPSLCIL
jgi:hypothetical protein